MKILNLSFYIIKEQELEAYLGRHSQHQQIFAGAARSHEIVHLHHTERRNRSRNDEHNRFVTMTGMVPLETFLFVRKYRPDVIFLHSFNYPLQAFILRLLAGKKTIFIVQHHAELPARNKSKRLLQRLAYKDFSRFIFTSSDMAWPFINEKICVKSRVREMMEISTTFFPENRDEARGKLGVTAEHVLIWVGRLNANKDPVTVLKALSALSFKNWEMAMIYSENTLEDEVRTFVQHNGLQQNVKMIGYVPNRHLQTWYSASDIFISASRYEGSGVALCEAMACGCLPVVTDIPAFRYMTAGASCGYLYPPGDAQALSEILSDFFNHTAPKRKRSPREIFEATLSYDAIARRLATILAEARA